MLPTETQMKSKMNLKSILALAGDLVERDRHMANDKFGTGLFDKSLQGLQQERIVVLVDEGRVQSRHGNLSSFMNYDWAKDYYNNPTWLWLDYIRPLVMTRLARERST